MSILQHSIKITLLCLDILGRVLIAAVTRKGRADGYRKEEGGGNERDEDLVSQSAIESPLSVSGAMGEGCAHRLIDKSKWESEAPSRERGYRNQGVDKSITKIEGVLVNRKCGSTHVSSRSNTQMN